MDEQIMSRAQLRARVIDKATAAFVRGDSIDSHNMNPGSPAHADWVRTFNLLKSGVALPQLHSAPATGSRIAQGQGEPA